MKCEIMKFKAKDNMTIGAIPTQSIEEVREKIEKNSSITTYISFIKGEVVELKVNNINMDGFSFDAFYKQSDGKVLYLFDLSESEFEKIEE